MHVFTHVVWYISKVYLIATCVTSFGNVKMSIVRSLQQHKSSRHAIQHMIQCTKGYNEAVLSPKHDTFVSSSLLHQVTKDTKSVSVATKFYLWVDQYIVATLCELQSPTLMIKCILSSSILISYQRKLSNYNYTQQTWSSLQANDTICHWQTRDFAEVVWL